MPEDALLTGFFEALAMSAWPRYSPNAALAMMPFWTCIEPP